MKNFEKYEEEIKKCCCNTNYSLEEMAEIQANLIMKRTEYEKQKEEYIKGIKELLNQYSNEIEVIK